MLNPRAIATLGIGYGPFNGALLGLWPVAEATPVTTPLGGALPRNRAGRRRVAEDQTSRARRREEEIWMILH
jgi:hypothetical protein